MQIEVVNPSQQTLWFLIILSIICVLTVRKNHPKESFFPVPLTNELKGIAILTVLFGHIGLFLATGEQFLYPLSVVSGVGVNIFLFLSGMGLTISQLQKPLTPISFYLKRLFKIFLPMWIVLGIFLVGDFLLLHKNYPLETIFLNIIGIFPRANLFLDINSPLWYFTFILFYYLTFPWLFYKRFPPLTTLIYLITTYYLFQFDLPIVGKDVEHLYQIHDLAFPVGILFGFGLSSNFFTSITHTISKFINQRYLQEALKIIIFLSGCYLFGYFAIHSGVGESLNKEQNISLISTLLMTLIIIVKPVRVWILEWFGKYSYEIYLIHWPLIYRYDLIYKFLPAYLATLLYIPILLFLGWAMQKAINRIQL